MTKNLPKSTLIHEVIAKQDAIISGKANIAPSDGKQYAMKDGVWTEVSSSFSGTLDNIPDGTTYKKVTQTEKNTWNAKSDLTLTTVKADTEIASAIALKHSNLLDHSHTNKSVLDGIQESLTAVLKGNYDTAYTHSQSAHAPSNAVSLATVKADAEIASAISLKHSNSLDHSHANKSALDLVSGTNTGDQDLSGKVDKVTGKGLSTEDYTTAEKSKLSGIESSAVALATVKADVDVASAISLKHSNSLDHSHSNKATLDNIQEALTTVLKSNYDTAYTNSHTHSNKSTLDSIQQALTTALKTNYDTAYTHSQSAHAPSNAQKNSDILKSEIEAVLTGVISSHSHASSGGLGYAINVQALTSSPVDGATVYFGMLPKAPVTVAGTSKVYIRKAGTIKIAEIYCYSGTAGTNEAWSLYIRVNNTTDYLIATLSVSTNERVFSNTGLSIAMSAGDYFEIKGVQPTWATNPLTCIYAGYIYIE